MEIAKSNKNDIRFMLHIRTYNKDILEQIRDKLNELGFKSYFYLDKKRGTRTSFGKIKRDFYGVRIYRSKDITKLIGILLSLTHHKEKVMKMEFILKNRDRKWNEVKDDLLQLRKQIRFTTLNQ